MPSSQEHTELAKKVYPRLRDLATAPAGGITQHRIHFFSQLCMRRGDVESVFQNVNNKINWKI